MEKSKKIFAWVMLVLCGVACGCLLGSWFVNMKPQNASAEIVDNQTYSFTSKNYSFVRYNNNTYISFNSFNYFNITKSGSNYNLRFNFDLSCPTYVSTGATSLNSNVRYFLNGYVSQNDSSFNSSLTQDTVFYSNTKVDGYTVTLSSSGVENYTFKDSIWFGCTYNVGSSAGIDLIDYVATGYSTINDLQNYDFIYCPSNIFGTYDSLKYVFFISCVDINGSSLTFFYAVDVNSELIPMYNLQLDYTENANTSSIDYSQGFNDGFNSGSSLGYNNGYDNGYTIGFANGRNQGISDSNSYSFLGLIGAVVDAPIQAFTGLFNFEILGVNLKDFLAGLFTICIVVMVVRYVMVK